MATVYVLEGWMGDIEWIEGIYADEATAQAQADELWETRTTQQPHVPDWTSGFCKFAVVPHPVITAATQEA